MISAGTMGNVTLYGPHDSPSDLNTPSGFPLGTEERKHTVQAQVLGPFYPLAHLVFGVYAIIGGGEWHDSILERGPHPQVPGTPSPW
jgi:hypothetical protein